MFEELLGELDIMEVPTFLFYRNGEEVGRHVGSSRGDLIGKVWCFWKRRGRVFRARGLYIPSCFVVWGRCAMHGVWVECGWIACVKSM